MTGIVQALSYQNSSDKLQWRVPADYPFWKKARCKTGVSIGTKSGDRQAVCVRECAYLYVVVYA